jgi:hypothetical protein
LTRKREVTLKKPDIHNNKGNLFKDKAKAVMDDSAGQRDLITEEEIGGVEDVAVKKWLADIIKNKLQKASILSLHTHKPICLCRKTIEESENAVEEEISYVTGNHVVHMIYAYGGCIPSSFQTIEVFTMEKFTRWILQTKKKDTLLQCLDGLE